MKERGRAWGTGSAVVATTVCVLVQTMTGVADDHLRGRSRMRVLTNGLTIVALQQSRAPFVSVVVVVRAGAAADPAGKEGLARLTAATLQTSGAGERSPEQVVDDLASVGASVSTRVDRDTSRLTAEFPRSELARGLELVADTVLRPRFDPTRILAARSRAVDARLTGGGDLVTRGRAALEALLFSDHPYGRPIDGTPQSLSTITPEDVAGFHEGFYAPGQTVVAIVGDVPTDDALDAVASRFGSWQPRSLPGVGLEPARAPAVRRVVIVDEPGAGQVVIAMGALGPGRAGANRGALRLANAVLGGRAASVLGRSLRGARAHARSPVSDLSEWTGRGMLTVTAAVAPERAAWAADVMLRDIQRLREAGVSEEDLTASRAFLKGQAGRSVESSDQLASLLADLVIDGLGVRDPLLDVSRLDTVTAPALTESVRALLQPDALTIVFVGDAKALKSVASTLAENVAVIPPTDR